MAVKSKESCESKNKERLVVNTDSSPFKHELFPQCRYILLYSFISAHWMWKASPDEKKGRELIHCGFFLLRGPFIRNGFITISGTVGVLGHEGHIPMSLSPYPASSFATVSSWKQLQQEWYSRLDSNVYCTLPRAGRYDKKLNPDFFQNVDSFEII